MLGWPLIKVAGPTTNSEGDLKVRLRVTSFLFGIIMPIFCGIFITFTLGEMFVI